MPDVVLFSGLANMVAKSAHVKPWVSAMFAYSTLGLENRVLAGYAERDGGVSVGGTIRLTADALSFEANKANRALVAGDLSLSLPCREIIRATGTNGIISGTLRVHASSGDFMFRCAKAPQKARAINELTNRSLA